MTIIDKLVNKQTTTQLQVLCTHTNMHTRLSAEFLHFLDFLFFSPTCTKMYLFTILCIYCGCTQSHLTFKNKYICNLLSMSPQNNSELTKHRKNETSPAGVVRSYPGSGLPWLREDVVPSRRQLSKRVRMILLNQRSGTPK